MLEMDGVISSPCFYLSEFFEHRNTEYQDRLLAVSEEDAWTEWCIFFLDAVATQAKENHRKANGIYELYQTTLEFLMKTVRTDNAANVAPHLFRMAIFPASVFTKEAGLNQSTAKRVVRSLKEAGGYRRDCWVHRLLNVRIIIACLPPFCISYVLEPYHRHHHMSR
ncbi:MAG: hypothetical protein IKG11_09795 [Atopobiaceae bacterium]|nr:hypothetical protein [Atopobiaceae bacterium]